MWGRLKIKEDVTGCFAKNFLVTYTRPVCTEGKARQFKANCILSITDREVLLVVGKILT
jgi:hypothetical protein